MYQKRNSGWMKHLDFMLMDLICLWGAYFMAYYVRYQKFIPFQEEKFINMFQVFFFCHMFVTLFNNSFKNVLKRGTWREITSALKQVILVVMSATFYLFATRGSTNYSRITIFVTAWFYFLLTCMTRFLWKAFLRWQGIKGAKKRTLVVMTTAGMAEEVVEQLRVNRFNGLRMVGLALMEDGASKWVGQEMNGIPVVADAATVAEYVCQEWVDEVFISLPREIPFPEQIYSELVGMGVTVHLHILRAMKLEGQEQNMGRLGAYTVLSSSINMVTTGQAFCKRLMDIIGGLLGCILTAILCIFVAPAIYIKSPGPIFFTQERVGRNGKKFKLYKFRSMYMDAEERKKELMEQNQIKDGMMFKMEHDPRIIGGEHGIGGIIRRFSIDEFPQFWNVLKGDMSLVGTRPPTVEEWEKYDLHHRVRLAAKPGITGLWQVSGRSGITDFEEVVKLDKTYIMDWTMGLDIRILLKTVKVVLMGDGAY